LVLLFAFVALIYSCKKDENTKLHATEVSADKQPEKIEPAEILSWVQNLPFQLPTDPAWDHATQAIINNEFVVKVPVSTDAALFFVKKNGVLQAYTYKWLYEKTDSKEFSGKVDIFNFQTMRLDRLVYKDGDNIKTVTLDDASPAQAPVLQTKQKINLINIGQAIAKIWCWLTGGSFYDNHLGDSFCSYGGSEDYGNSGSAGDYYSGIFGGGGLSGSGGNTGGTGGNGGGGTWVPDPGTGNCDIKVAVVGNGKLRVQLLPPGDGCPPAGTPYPIQTPKTGDKYDAKFVKSVGILKITTIISELENQYAIQLGLTDLEKAQFAAQLFDAYKADFNTNFASLQIVTDEGDDPPFIAWLRGKIRKMLAVDAPNGNVELQQINNELGAWGAIGQRILQLRENIRVGDVYPPTISQVFEVNLGTEDALDKGTYEDGNYDNTTYLPYQQSNPWPFVNTVIPRLLFTGMSTNKENCLDACIRQIAVMKYRISKLDAPGQTMQVYKENQPINIQATKDAVAYLQYALANKIPVIVGVSNAPGGPNLDKSTNHWVVIVGSGTDSNGKYFRFYDGGATNQVVRATSVGNKLYYNPTTGEFKGISDTNYGAVASYQMTMVRKSKKIL
jgi:hypothetical protein